MKGGQTLPAELALKIAGNEIATIDIGALTLDVHVQANSEEATLTLGGVQGIRSALREALANALAALDAEGEPADPVCANHKPAQHRDGKPPWRNACGQLSWDRDPSKPACVHTVTLPVNNDGTTACETCGQPIQIEVVTTPAGAERTRRPLPHDDNYLDDGGYLPPNPLL